MAESTPEMRSAAGPVGETPWTTKRLLGWMHAHFAARKIDSPRLVSELLLMHVIGCERMRLYMEADRLATPEERQQLRDLVQRAAGHEPVQYLVGRWSFFSREFLVEPCTLIPQPCTEELVDYVIRWWRGSESESQTAGHPFGVSATPTADAEAPKLELAAERPLIADIGTGTGCIAISLALDLPGSRIIATDIVPQAINLARRNAELHRVADRIEFMEGSIVEPLRAQGLADFNIICSNPPYIPDDEWARGEVDKSVRDHVPTIATRGGADGLDIIRPLIREAGALLRPNGLLIVEIAASQENAVMKLAAQATDLEEVRVLNELEGRPRFFVAKRTRANSS